MISSFFISVIRKDAEIFSFSMWSLSLEGGGCCCCGDGTWEAKEKRRRGVFSLRSHSVALFLSFSLLFSLLNRNVPPSQPHGPRAQAPVLGAPSWGCGLARRERNRRAEGAIEGKGEQREREKTRIVHFAHSVFFFFFAPFSHSLSVFSPLSLPITIFTQPSDRGPRARSTREAHSTSA